MSEFILGDCLDYMRKMPDKAYDLAIVDPPYGIAVNKMSLGKGVGVAQSKSYMVSEMYHSFNDTAPTQEYFNELFRVSKNQIIWGGNYFNLPPSACWVVWDKQKNEKSPFADCELAWGSFKTPIRIFHYAWHGFIQGDMKHKEERIHPTQKPVALYEWLLTRYATKGDKILDTHVGSGSSLIACENLGFEYTGFEIDPVFYKNAQERMKEYSAQLRMDL